MADEKKYIEAGEVEKLLIFALDDDWEPEYAVDRLNEIPAADVQSVVRCRDCKYCLKVDEQEYWCNGLGSPVRLVRPDDYCSCGADMREEGDVPDRN